VFENLFEKWSILKRKTAYLGAFGKRAASSSTIVVDDAAEHARGGGREGVAEGWAVFGMREKARGEARRDRNKKGCFLSFGSFLSFISG
jgi:hypothetical protein